VWPAYIKAEERTSNCAKPWEQPVACALYIGVVKNQWHELVELLRGAGVLFRSGLTDEELLRAEENYNLTFPPDLREFLKFAMPWGLPFPDWRTRDDPFIRETLDLPLHGMLFDVENNAFWLSEWGPKPPDNDEAKRIVEEHVAQAPRLIPIYSHRMIPDRPHETGNPVFSVHQTDIIYYGFDIDDYFRHEFNLPGRKAWPDTIRNIEFWDVDRFQDLRWRE
jgi:hypothetical protein